MTTDRPSTALPAHSQLWLGKAAPRYTSYPPATQFKLTQPVDLAAAPLSAPLPVHLQEIAQSASPISLYLHIPFCRELCLFCGCHSIITKRPERISAYLVALLWEIDLVGKALQQATGGKRVQVAHLHFGGGSPSSLLPEQFSGLMAAIRRYFDFVEGAELAIELDPRTTQPELVAQLAKEGINRASLGVQDFRSEVQQIIHRIQPYALVQGVMDNLRANGITALSVDMMYGLPRQTPDSLQETAQQVISLNPQRVSMFSYAHVPAMKPYQKALEAAGLPDDATRLQQEQAIRTSLQAAGYVAIGIDHFAKPDDPLAVAQANKRLYRNFQGYTDDPAELLLGLGASAISNATSQYVQNEPDLARYQHELAAGRLPLKRHCVRQPQDHVRASIIRELMCHFTVDLAGHVEAGHKPLQVYAKELAALAPFVAQGLVHLEGSRIMVDTTYRMAVRSVAAVFDEYLNPASIASRVA